MMNPDQYYNNQRGSFHDEYDPVLFHLKVEKRDWKGLWAFDTESIWVSVLVPYHVVAKISIVLGYSYKLVYYFYFFLCLLFYSTIYLYTQLFLAICPKHEYSSNHCFDLTEHNCSTYYVSNSETINRPCVFNEKYHICYTSDNKCIIHDQSVYLLIIVIILNVLSFGGCGYINICLRKSFKERQLVVYNKWIDPLIALFLTPLSLAQQYKDLSADPKEFEGVTGIRL